MAALKILDHGDVVPGAMTGSYAGAMGQPQFMPSSYLRYAVDFEGNGRRDIWTSKPDVLGSIANYLAASGWRAGETWGQAVTVPAGVEAPGRDAKRPVSEWARAGVRPVTGRWAAPPDTPAGLVAPDGAGGETFVVFGNFAAIRRYNPSDLLCHRGRPDRRPGGRVTHRLDDRRSLRVTSAQRRAPVRRSRSQSPAALGIALFAAGLHAAAEARPALCPGQAIPGRLASGTIPQESFDLDETGIASIAKDDRPAADHGWRGLRPDRARRRPSDHPASRDRPPDQPGERPRSHRPAERPWLRRSPPPGRGHPPHRDPARHAAGRRRPSPAARAAERKPCRRRGAAGRAVPGDDRCPPRRGRGRGTGPPPGVRQGNGRHLPVAPWRSRRTEAAPPRRRCACRKWSPRRRRGPAS